MEHEVGLQTRRKGRSTSDSLDSDRVLQDTDQI